MDDLFQSGSIDGYAVWQAVLDQGRRVRALSSVVCCLSGVSDRWIHSIMRHSETWYKRSQYNHPVRLLFTVGCVVTRLIYIYIYVYRGQYDIHLCAYSTLLRIISKFHEEVYSDLESPTGLNEVGRGPRFMFTLASGHSRVFLTRTSTSSPSHADTTKGWRSTIRNGQRSSNANPCQIVRYSALRFVVCVRETDYAFCFCTLCVQAVLVISGTLCCLCMSFHPWYSRSLVSYPFQPRELF